jgi:hypothetical protein
MTEEFTIKGEWFLPSNREQRIYGTLNYNPIEGAKLELFESFNADNFFPNFINQEIILGLTSDSKKVVLYNCLMIKSGGLTLVQGEEAGKPSVSYSIRYTLIGLHVANINELKFDKISCDIFNLGEWVGISGFINQPPDFENLKRKEIQVNYKLPDAIEFQIDKEAIGRFNFFADHSGFSRYQKNINISQRVEFQASTITEKNIDELLKYVISFQNFLILALYRSTYPISITLSGAKHKKEYDDGITERNTIKLFFSSSNFKDNENPKSYFDMIFSYRQIINEFPELIKNWFAKYELLEPAFNLLFEQFYNGNRFTENTFLNLAQSAETFHSRIHDHTKIPKTDYELMRNEILEMTSSKYHGWLKEQFNFGNDLNLHTRLTELTDKYSNEILDKILGDKKQFVLQVKHSRNYYTHYSKNGKKNALKGSALFYLTEKLKILLVCSFLMEIGFEKNQLSSSLNDVKWRLFNHLASWRE